MDDPSSMVRVGMSEYGHLGNLQNVVSESLQRRQGEKWVRRRAPSNNKKT